jgi:hypothetical protein
MPAGLLGDSRFTWGTADIKELAKKNGDFTTKDEHFTMKNVD